MVKKTFAIVGAAVLAGITAAITAATTGLIGTGVSNIRGLLVLLLARWS
jgi:hypothetical protein